jgi:hypothetical protein
MRFLETLLEMPNLARKGKTSGEPSGTGPKRLGLEHLEPRMMLSASAAWSGFGTLTAPTSPTLVAQAVSASQVHLAWTAEPSSTSYKVYELAGGIWQQIVAVAGDTTSCSVEGLTAGTTFCFDVAARNSAGAAWAPGVDVTTLPGSPPLVPALTAMAASAAQANLTWGGDASATQYKVYELAGGAWEQIATLGSITSDTGMSDSVTSYSVTGLSAGTTYYFDVAAQNSGGVTWAPARKVSTPAAVFLHATINEPAAAAAYSPVSGELFGPGGPSYLDVEQGYLGDCWLLSSLAEVAVQAPQDIRDMFMYEGAAVENGAMVGLYQVRFFNSAGTAEYVTVDTELPAGGAYYDQPANGVLWVALAEKAYAEANGAGIVTSGTMNSSSYSALNGGDPSWALQAITGQPAADYYVDSAGIAAAWQAGGLVVLCSSPNADDNLVVGDSSVTHAYAMIGYNPSSSTPFEIYNPWGESTVVGALTTYNGGQVYAGAFYASASLISQDFIVQSDGTGATETSTARHHRSVTPAEVLFAQWGAPQS